LPKEKIPEGNEHFVLQEYRWMDFGAKEIVFPDNPRASVVCGELHDPEELKRSVRTPMAFQTRFRAPVKPLFPIDLTEDYRRFVAETIQRRKRRNLDEDDSSTIDFSEIATPPEVEDRMMRWRSRKGETPGAEAAPETVSQRATEQPTQPLNPLDALMTSSAPRSNEMQPAGPVTVGTPADAEAFQDAAALDSNRKGMAPAGDISKEARDRILAKLNVATAIPLLEHEQTQHRDIAPTVESTRLVDAPQAAATIVAVDESKDDHDGAQPQLKVDAQKSEQDFAAGYAQALEKFRDLGASLGAVTKEVSDLRTQVLREGRDIFLEIIKLTAESILRRKIGVSDQALFELFDTALENLHSAAGRIAVQANGQTLSRLKDQYSEAGLSFDSIEWIANDKIPLGDFKVVAKDEVVRVDLESLIAKEINRLAQDIFSESENPSTTGGQRSDEEAG
jgi:flagellar biosynthesis/type III secretory pathway protein FliH